MIELSLDTGKTPSVLAALANPALQNKLVKSYAESYVDETLDWIADGRAFTSRTGLLEQSIGWRPVGNATAEVFAFAEYAGHVEFGTDAHVIEPKPGRQALKIPVAGNGFAFVKSVNHPGSKPYPFFFADSAQRSRAMTKRGLSVLAAYVRNVA